MKPDLHLAPAAPTRRGFLARGGALAAAAFGATTLAPLALLPRSASAADYKALVTVMLYGGNDAMNCIVPTDNPRHGQYAGVRGALAVPQGALVPLAGSNYGLHPSLAALAPHWNSQRLAAVFNVGPLNRPLSKAQYLAAIAGAEEVPQALFSHSDQQIQWETASSVSLTREGWGGRASALLGTTNPVISVGGNGRFGVEALRSPLVLPGPGSGFGAYGLRDEDMGWELNVRRRAAVDAMYGPALGNQLQEAFRQQQNTAFEVSDRLEAIVGALPGEALSGEAIDAAFAPLVTDGYLNTYLAGQLYQVAKLIRHNATVQGTRQVFFAQQGGYDTHEGQVGSSATTGTHAELLRELGDALAAFQRAMDNLGLAEQVTLFTQSDFGRTFVPNSTAGTDHAWGAHQFVLGGAVNGRATYGTYPQLVVGGLDDVGVEEWELQGRWIPSTGVDQLAATLLGWFGATPAQQDAILPNLVNYGSARTLGFL
jgi:uncharacterized protein (DUF1501 family)